MVENSGDGGDPNYNPGDENKKRQVQETSTKRRALMGGPPKQKWTQEEEEALKSGVTKHGAGRWHTILKDPEFSGVLYLRSNIDLKDKWRNMCLMATRENSRLDDTVTLSVPKPKEQSPAIKQVSTRPALRRPKISFVDMIMEAIVTLEEPGGSKKKAIHAYIKEHCNVPPDIELWLSTKLEYLTHYGELIKVNRKYRIPNSTPDRDEVNILTRSQIKAELARMKTMNVHEAAEAAAQAVAEAETAMALAEQAVKEAEAAEADAEAAQVHAEETSKTLKQS